MNKPEGFTSFDVVAKLRGILKTRKIGHTGTLDPMASGVLPVLVGAAAKALDILPNTDKGYDAGFKLGISTDTQDITGKVLDEKSVSQISAEMISKEMKAFEGEIEQIPPMYSAVSVGGKRLYELARKGIEVERQPRRINVFRFELLDFNKENAEGRARIFCSKGTYVRTLINDLGERLGCGAAMTSLVRTHACGFSLKDCTTFEELAGREDFSDLLLPVERLFDGLPKIVLSPPQARMYLNGVRLDLSRLSFSGFAERHTVWANGIFIGTALPDVEKGMLCAEKTFNRQGTFYD